MNITLGVTDNAWAAYLRDHPDVVEANFWVPSARNFTGKARVNEPFLFKTKSPANQLMGGGFIAGFWELRVSEAWATFGHGNGVASEADLLAAIQVYRDRNKYDFNPDPTIGCLILRNLFFARQWHELPQPERWGASIVQGKTYEPRDDEYDYVKYAFETLKDGARLDPVWDRDLIRIDAERYGTPYLTKARLGQGSFRLAVLDAYERRCAITGSRTEPMLDAAHIRAYADGGAHAVSNGLALRADLHRLYDKGFIAIDPDYKLRVSPHLSGRYGNGVDLYAREERGEQIRLPKRSADLPDADALAWHLENRFLAS